MFRKIVHETAEVGRTLAWAFSPSTFAAGIKARGEALAANPNLPILVQAERWNGVLPTTMVPGDSVPFVDVTPKPVTN